MQLGNSIQDIAWEKLGDIGVEWKLLSFAQPAPPKWEVFWANEREYWGADDPNKGRVQQEFGTTDTEANLLRKSKEKYAEYQQYLRLWNGLCAVGDTVAVMLSKPHVVVLSKHTWRGGMSDHADLEIQLKQEKTFFGRHVQFLCDMYRFGTVMVLPGSPEAKMGEQVGTQRVAHWRGRGRVRSEVISFDADLREVTVRDATFRVVA